MRTSRFIYFLAIVFTIAACQPSSDLETAKKDLAELESQYATLGEQIEEAQKNIAKLDTNKTEKANQTLVTLTEAQRKRFVSKIRVPGTADSKRNILVSAESNGNVTRIYVAEGNMVKKGQIIASIDSEIMRSQIAELETNLDFAKQMFEKQERLWSKKIGSEVQYLQAKNQKESLEKSIQSLKAQAAKSTITAPISGYLDHVFLREGQTVTMGTSAVRIVDLNSIRILADVSEKYIGQFSKSDSIDVQFPSLKKSLRVKIGNIGQVVSVDNRTFMLEATIQNKDQMIKPNILADVSIPIYKNDNALTIPTSVIQQGKDHDFIYIAKQNGQQLTAEKRKLTLGATYHSETEILDGLKEGEKIVNLGSRNIANGDPIKVAE